MRRHTFSIPPPPGVPGRGAPDSLSHEPLPFLLPNRVVAGKARVFPATFLTCEEDASEAHTLQSGPTVHCFSLVPL